MQGCPNLVTWRATCHYVGDLSKVKAFDTSLPIRSVNEELGSQVKLIEKGCLGSEIPGILKSFNFRFSKSLSHKSLTKI